MELMSLLGEEHGFHLEVPRDLEGMGITLGLVTHLICGGYRSTAQRRSTRLAVF